MFNWPGLAFAYAINSERLLAGTLAGTTSRCDHAASVETGAKLFKAS